MDQLGGVQMADSVITAESGSCNVIPQLSNCNIGGSVSINVAMQSHGGNDTLQMSGRSAAHQGDHSGPQVDAILERVKGMHKANLQEKVEHILEGTTGNEAFLNEVYTEVSITGEKSQSSAEHEMWQINSAFTTSSADDAAVDHNNIFKPLEGTRKTIKTVLTKGIAGIGKTVLVQKFILDWAEGKANQDIDFIFLLPLRELNLTLSDQFSLFELLKEFHTELTDLEDAKVLSACKTLFILDGLDECRLPLDFHQNKRLSDVTKPTSVDILLTNLIKGNLLPSARLWITSRPAATNQIPSKYISQTTEVQGFKDAQKEQYFRKKFSDDSTVCRIMSYIKPSRSLYTMCQIPIFCWIYAMVLGQMLCKGESGPIPKTLTEMYTHFLLIQTSLKNEKYNGRNETDPQKLLQSDKDILLKLGKLAFENLVEKKFMFSEEDLSKVGIDVNEAAIHTGVFTEIVRKEAVFYQRTVYLFIHLSVQEFLAALYVFHGYTAGSIDEYFHCVKSSDDTARYPQMHEFLKAAVDKALESNDGHLDMFLRFIHGLSLESVQMLLRGVLKQIQVSPESIEESKLYLKQMQMFDISPERCINLLLCLTEMNDYSVLDDIQEYMTLENKEEKHLSPAHCSAIAYMLLVSEKVLDEFNLKEYKTSWEGRRRLLPIVRCCRKALLDHCRLTGQSCESVAAALHAEHTHLRELDLSYNDLTDDAIQLLKTGLMSPHCKLQTLRMNQCYLTAACCEALASVLTQSFHSSHLRELDLSDNDLQDAGVKLLSAGVGNPLCKLETLKLSFCGIAMEGSVSLASALKSNPTHMRELDLSYNHLGDTGVSQLSSRLQDPLCRLESLNVEHGAECWLKSGLKKCEMTLNIFIKEMLLDLPQRSLKLCLPPLSLTDACQLTLDPDTAYETLSLSNGLIVPFWFGEPEWPCSENPEQFDSHSQVLCKEGLTGRCYWEVDLSRGQAIVGVAYKGISRKGEGNECKLGHNDKSWCVSFSAFSYVTSGITAWHNDVRIDVFVKRSFYHGRVGVFLDWEEGTLSYYWITSGTLIHLYTFHAKFTEPLYPAFRVWGKSMIELVDSDTARNPVSRTD
uniref:NLR family CARD domain-containing protein 3-like isoform X1 n=1 Tax=Centroberyx gerrardi TaxID=166262 RepID=UPI003AAA53AC